jgi:hypothetical protein
MVKKGLLLTLTGLACVAGFAFAAGFAVAQGAPQPTQPAPQTGPSEVHDWKTGKAYWLDANAAGTRHQDINIGEDPIEVMVVELQDEK